MRARRIFYFVTLMIFSAIAGADNTCTKYGTNASYMTGQKYDTREEACDATCDQYTDGNNHYCTGWVLTTTNNCKITKETGTQTTYLDVVYNNQPCPDPCENAPDYIGIDSPINESVNEVCSDSCTYTYDPAASPTLHGTHYQFLFSKTLTGTQCTGDTFDNFTNPNTTAAQPTVGGDGICGPTASGGELCYYYDGANQNCGEYNDQYICTPDYPDTGECYFLGTTGYICAPNAADKPKTANGTALPPDGTIQEGLNTANIYDDATVQGSSNLGEGTIPDPTTPAPTAEEIGSAVAGALSGVSLTVDANIPTASETANAIESAISDAATGKADADNSGYSLDTIHSDFVSALEGSDVYAMASSMSQSWPAAASCPEYTVALFGSNITMDYHCTLMANIGAALSAAFLVLWSLIGIRVVMSA